MSVPVPGPVVDASNVCWNCHSPLASQMKFCGQCGAQQRAPEAPRKASTQAPTQFLHAAEEVALSRPRARLITIESTGLEGLVFNLTAAETLCGRTQGAVNIADPFVSPRHCVFRFLDGRLAVRDLGSANGVYLRLRGEMELRDGDSFRVGRQLLRFEAEANIPRDEYPRAAGDDARRLGSPPAATFGRLAQVLETGCTGEVFLLCGGEAKIGRVQGDIVFGDDGFVSTEHCLVSRKVDRVFLSDLGSSNGTYLRVRDERVLRQDDLLIIGQRMLRVELGAP